MIIPHVVAMIPEKFLLRKLDNEQELDKMILSEQSKQHFKVAFLSNSPLLYERYFKSWNILLGDYSLKLTSYGV